MLRHPEVSQPRQWVLWPTWHGRFESNAITARIMSKDNFVLGNQHDSHRSNAMTARLCLRTTSCLGISTSQIEVTVPHWAACNRWELLSYSLVSRSNFVWWVPLWGGGDSRKKARVLVVIEGRKSLTWTILSPARPMTRPLCYTSNRLLVRSVWIGLTLGLAVAAWFRPYLCINLICTESRRSGWPARLWGGGLETFDAFTSYLFLLSWEKISNTGCDKALLVLP